MAVCCDLQWTKQQSKARTIQDMVCVAAAESCSDRDTGTAMCADKSAQLSSPKTLIMDAKIGISLAFSHDMNYYFYFASTI